MSIQSKAFEKFGEIFISWCRDYSIDSMDWIVDGTAKAPAHQKLVETFSDMTPEQRQAVKELIARTVDTTLHNVLYIFESESDLAKIHLQDGEEDIADIRSAAAGDLQGYIFIWSEKYSKQRLSHESPK